MNPLKRPSFLLGMAIMFFVLAGCSAVLPMVGKVMFGSKEAVKSVTLPTATPRATATKVASPTNAPTGTPTPAPAETCVDFSGRTLKVDEVNQLGQKCKSGNKLLQPDGKSVVNGLPSPTPTAVKR